MRRIHASLAGAVAGMLLVSTGCTATRRPKVAQESPRAVPAALDADLERARAFAFQGDLRSALPIMKALPASSLDAKRLRLRDAFLARFSGNGMEPVPAGLDPWTAKVLVAYRTYWKQVMLGEQPRAPAEEALAKTLAKLLQRPDSQQAPDLNALEEPLLAALESHGWHGLLGVTSPFRELLLWKRQTEVKHDIALPEGQEQVTVVMLSDFASLGWLGYATLDESHTGGWTKPDRLFCVAPAYDTKSESFRVSYLAHEGQHFRDNRLFPKLEQPELEYRAKLVELALADQTLTSLLESFEADQSADRERPHSFANRRLMTEFVRSLSRQAVGASVWWAGLPPDAIHAAARRLLLQDTLALGRSPVTAH